MLPVVVEVVENYKLGSTPGFSCDTTSAVYCLRLLPLLFWDKKTILERNMRNDPSVIYLFIYYYMSKCTYLILSNIMFHALTGRFQLELFNFITYFSTAVPLTSCVFFPVGLSSLTRHIQLVL